jgi:hypothetical protein
MTPPSTPSPEELGLDENAATVDRLARDVLGNSYIYFEFDHVELKEEVSQGRVSFNCELIRCGSGERNAIRGQGVGMIDALFDGVILGFADEYPSLKTIAVSNFTIGSGFESAQGRKSDATAEAKLDVENSEGTIFHFHRASPSITRSSIRTVLDALTFFINSERAYVQLHLALKDAKERRRSDLVVRYRTQMSTLVRATSYSEVIERLQKEADE